jgi:DNA-binding MarR family transcriptional regulator
VSTAHAFAFHLRLAYLALHRRANARFAGHGVTADQFVLLTSLARGEAATQRELVERIGSDPNTVRAMLVRLESQGLVVRTPHARDARALRVALTPDGRRLQARLFGFNETFQADLLALFSEAERATLAALLDRITGHLSQGGTRSRGEEASKPTPESPR